MVRQYILEDYLTITYGYMKTAEKSNINYTLSKPIDRKKEENNMQGKDLHKATTTYHNPTT
jgi:hypothetical protein